MKQERRRFYEWLGIVSEPVRQFQAVELPTESNNSESGVRAGAQS
jgi:hypothetical protein